MLRRMSRAHRKLENTTEGIIVTAKVVFSSGPGPSHQCTEVSGLGGWVGGRGWVGYVIGCQVTRKIN